MRKPRDPSELVAFVPDEPRWIDARGLLTSGRCRVLEGGEAHGDFVLVSDDYPFGGVVGRPGREALLAAAARPGPACELLVQEESREHVSAALPGWQIETTWIHELPSDPAGEAASIDPAVRLLAPGRGERLDHVPAELRRELRIGLELSPVAAWFEGELPVAFCYAAVMTPTLWDVAVDTLEPWRGRGLAGRCFTLMRRRMLEQGRRAIWGAHASNGPSLRLAAKLGFRRIARLWTFRPPR